MFKIETNYSEKQPKVKYMQYTNKKVAGGRQEGLEMLR